MSRKFILFDFDGVIANSYHVALEVQRTICPAITDDQYRKRFEGNVNESNAHADYHTEDCRHDIEWFSEYVPKMKTGVILFPGMKEVVHELGKNHTLLIISSTTTSPIEEFLSSHNLREHFDWVMGNDVHTSKVEKIKMALQRYGVSPDDCLFITDTLGDIREASVINVPAIAVTWGFNHPHILLEGNPLKLVDTPEELIISVSKHFAV